MTFSDLYFSNNDWEPSTVLNVHPCKVNKNEELTASRALLMYSDHEVVFTSNWVVLRASD